MEILKNGEGEQKMKAGNKKRCFVILLVGIFFGHLGLGNIFAGQKRGVFFQR